jgi:hypothetical protein
MTDNPYDYLAKDLYRRLVNANHVAPTSCAAGASCITIAAMDGFVSLQDSKLDGPQRHARTQIYTAAELAAFVRDAKAGHYDDIFDPTQSSG